RRRWPGPGTSCRRRRSRSWPAPRPWSVPEQRADATEDVEVGVVAAHLDAARLGDRLGHGVLDDVVELLHGPPADRARSPLDGEQVARAAAPARADVALGDEQGVDAALDQTGEHVTQPGDAATRADGVAQPADGCGQTPA